MREEAGGFTYSHSQFHFSKHLVRKLQTYTKVERIKKWKQNRILVLCPRFNNYQLIANPVSFYPTLPASTL